VVGPGVLVAATGVGAGDLGAAAFAGGHLGLTVLWAVVLGAAVKLVLNEQLARWQLATGTTILEGAVRRLGPAVWAIFGVYLVLWSPFVALALMKACAAVLDAIAPIAHPWAYAIASSAAGLAMVWLGGFALFQRVMAACVVVMVAVVLVAAVVAAPAPGAVLAGLVPGPPRDAGALGWTIALVGGVGGTLTIICYAYWMRETGRHRSADLARCRLDLALGYGMTALFGVGMIVLASGLSGGGGALEGRGAGVIPLIAQRIADTTGGPAGRALRWAFLAGALGAVFSSLLGVWQAVPYVFADWWAMRPWAGAGGPGGGDGPMPDAPPDALPASVGTGSLAYRGYLVALATLPCSLLFASFETAQKLYGVVGAGFIPLLACALLVLNNRPRWVGERLCNRWPSNLALVGALAVSAVAAGWSIAGRL